MRQRNRPLYPCKGLERGRLDREIPCGTGQCSVRDIVVSLQQPIFQHGSWMCLTSIHSNGGPHTSLHQKMRMLEAILESWLTLEHRFIVLLPGPVFLPHPSELDDSIFAKTPFSQQWLNSIFCHTPLRSRLFELGKSPSVAWF